MQHKSRKQRSDLNLRGFCILRLIQILSKNVNSLKELLVNHFSVYSCKLHRLFSVRIERFLLPKCYSVNQYWSSVFFFRST